MLVKKAIILAGGLGERLRPLTLDTPKPLLQIKEKPILQYCIENIKRNGINEIIISIGYQAEKIKEYFKDGSDFNVKIDYVIEKDPLGTGGAVKEAAKAINEPFLLIWGDNLMDIDIVKMSKEHKNNNALVTMALTEREDVENFGVAILERNKIIGFVEKPDHDEAPTNMVNAGAFIINPSVLEILPKGKSSIEKDCFEKIAGKEGKLCAFQHKGYWYPTDTIEKYNKAKEDFSENE